MNTFIQNLICSNQRRMKDPENSQVAKCLTSINLMNSTKLDLLLLTFEQKRMCKIVLGLKLVFNDSIPLVVKRVQHCFETFFV